MKERCYVIPDSRGGTLRYRAAKPPTPRTIEALQELFALAYAEAEKRQLSELPGESEAMARFRRRLP